MPERELHALTFLVLLVAAPGLSAAEQTKSTPPPTTKLAPVLANVPTRNTKVSTAMTIPVEPKGSIGNLFTFNPGIVMDGGKTSPIVLWKEGEHCRVEVDVPGWPVLSQERTCGHDFLFDVPESVSEGVIPIKARFVAVGRMLTSDWAYTTLTIRKSKTKLELLSVKPVGSPMKVGAVGPTLETFEVRIGMTKPYAGPYFEKNLPVVKRTVIVNIQGQGNAGPVSPSDVNGFITLRVVRTQGESCVAQVAFMGDSAYEPSILSVKMPP